MRTFEADTNVKKRKTFLKYWIKSYRGSTKNRKESVEWIREKWLNEWTNWRENFCFLKYPRSKYEIERRKKSDDTPHQLMLFVITSFFLFLSIAILIFCYVFFCSLSSIKKKKKEFRRHILVSICFFVYCRYIFCCCYIHTSQKKFSINNTQ